MLGDSQFGPLLHNFAVINSDATLAEAKSKMDEASAKLGSTGSCRDIFVTATGSATEPVLGWITNDIINDNAKV